MSFKDGSIAIINYFSNGSKVMPKERIELFCNNSILKLDNFLKLTGYEWPGFKSLSLRSQDKGHKKELSLFFESVRKGTKSPIPLNEILEVSKETIILAENI